MIFSRNSFGKVSQDNERNFSWNLNLRFKRIVLFDTLLEESERMKLKTDEEREKEAEEKEEKEEKEDKTEEKNATGCNNQEIVAVLGHELGHWKMNHVLKNILIAQVDGLFAP